MFETSVIKSCAVAAPRRAGLLSLSLAFHVFAISGAIVMSVASTSFPRSAPNQMASFRPTLPVVEPPLPRGNPNAQRNPAPQPPPAQRAQTAPAQPQAEVTPNQIPDHASAVPVTDTAGNGSGPGSSTDQKWGVPVGDPNAIDIGQTAEVPQAAAPSTPLHVSGDVHAARVLSRVDPVYPHIALQNRIGGVVKLQCVIDKNGQLSDPQILFSSFPAFNAAAIDALRRWTFAPGTLHGQPVDTYFELTITFQAR